MPRLRSALTLSLLLLSTLAAVQAGNAAPVAVGPVDAKTDPRLARHVHLRSYGVTLDRVLKRLTEKTGVLLQVSGPPAEEPVAAFAPDTPLADVMASLADLYRLRWERSATGKNPAYRLVKSLAQQREEAEALDAGMKTVVDRLLKSLAAGPAQPGGDNEAYFAALKHLTPAQWQELLDSGFLNLEFKALPEAQRDKLATALHPLANRFYGARLRNLSPGSPDPTKVPLEQTGLFQLELTLGEKAVLGAGFSAWGIQSYSAEVAVTEEPTVTSMSLFTGRDLRPVRPADAKPDTGVFDRPVPSQARIDYSVRGWMYALGHLADATGAAIYADVYAEEDEARYVNLRHMKTATLGPALDEFCGENRSASAGSFWWRRGEAALIRSRKCLWQSASRLPSALLERLHERFIVAREGQLQPAELSMLASLSKSQVVNYAEPGHFGKMSAWRYAIQLPSRLSADAKSLYLKPTRPLVRDYQLSWDALPEGDRKLLLALPDPPLQEGVPQLKLKVTLAGGYTGLVVHEQHVMLILDTEWGGKQSHLNMFIPLNTVQSTDLLVTDPARMQRALPERPKLVLARYYGWFGLPETSGSLQHIKGVSPGKVDGFWQYPTGGPYDSSDAGTIARQLQQLKDAGVDALIYPWYGPEHQTGKALRPLLTAAKDKGLRVAISLGYPSGAKGSDVAPTLLNERIAALQPILSDPAYLTLGPQPVLFLDFRVRLFYDHQGWADTLARWEKELGKPLAVLGTGETERDGEIFNGLFRREPAAFVLSDTKTRGERLESEAAQLATIARPRARLTAAVILPGLTSRFSSGRGEQVVPVSRADGRLYREFWELALGSKPDWVIIESFNNWELNTQIEPSTEDGDRFLKLTAEYAARFKAPPPPPVKKTGSQTTVLDFLPRFISPSSLSF